MGVFYIIHSLLKYFMYKMYIHDMGSECELWFMLLDTTFSFLEVSMIKEYIVCDQNVGWCERTHGGHAHSHTWQT